MNATDMEVEKAQRSLMQPIHTSIDSDIWDSGSD
jgi:hypothetical protein